MPARKLIPVETAAARVSLDARLVRLNARINEQIGRQVAGVFDRSLREMNLTPEQWEIAREVFPRELRALGGDGG